MTHAIDELGDKWEMVETREIAFHFGKGSAKKLFAKVRFDGNGNAIVRFTVTDHDRVTEYEKYDAAASAYNRLP